MSTKAKLRGPHAVEGVWPADALRVEVVSFGWFVAGGGDEAARIVCEGFVRGGDGSCIMGCASGGDMGYVGLVDLTGVDVSSVGNGDVATHRIEKHGTCR
eukprot:6173064-Pleurochrysis_carterae.AAC.5